VSSKLQLDVCYLNQWWRHLVNAYRVEVGMVKFAGKLCDSYQRCKSTINPLTFTSVLMHREMAVKQKTNRSTLGDFNFR